MTYTGEQKREYQRKWLTRRRSNYLSDKSCVKCGSITDLEIDHIDPSTKDPRLKPGTGLWSWTEERRNIELEKCQILCKICHKKKTAEWWKSIEIKCGTVNSYVSKRKRCRCLECCKAHTEYEGNRRRKLRKELA